MVLASWTVARPYLLSRCPPITHLNIAAFYLNENDNTYDIWVTLNNNKPDNPYFDFLWKDVKTFQVYGVKVLAMLGGAVSGVFSRLDKDSDSDTFKKSYGAIKDLIETYNFDGVDVDVEEAMLQKGINYLIDRLVDDFGDDFLITLAPVARALMGDGSSNLLGFNYITLEKDRGDSIAWYNAQFYNGWGSINDTTGYGNIMDNPFKPQRVVAGVLTNSAYGSGYVDLDTLKKVLKELVKKYGGTEFGGVAAWEYEKSNPDPTEPWQWAQVMRDTLG
ncbi:glycoside hydrolase family 18 protein [Xylariaceae sp. AK1471]|nr:glycoside hydrolase family 18 protein [Xylariaceae sp. AK1471]